MISNPSPRACAARWAGLMGWSHVLQRGSWSHVLQRGSRSSSLTPGFGAELTGSPAFGQSRAGTHCTPLPENQCRYTLPFSAAKGNCSVAAFRYLHQPYSSNTSKPFMKAHLRAIIISVPVLLLEHVKCRDRSLPKVTAPKVTVGAYTAELKGSFTCECFSYGDALPWASMARTW